MRLKDKVIIVTGSTSGIGAATAKRCVQEGAKVVVHGIEKEQGEPIANSLGDSAVLHIADLVEPETAKQLVEVAVRSFGKLDAIVNNAGLVTRSTIESTTPEFFDRVMNINCRAPMLLIQAGLEQLKHNKGCVVNIGSVNAYCGEATFVAYSVSKGALTTLTRNLGDSLLSQHGVRVNQINPGWVLTENEHQLQLRDGNSPDWYKELPIDIAPSGRIFAPEELAEAVVFLLSDAAGPISGTVLDIGQFPFTIRNPVKDID